MYTALRLVALVGVILCTFSISISSQSAIQIPGKIEVENYSSFYDLDPGNQGGACRTDDVDLYVTWDPPDGGCNLGHTKATEWVAFTINVTQANTYVLSARVAHPGVGGTFHVEVDGVDVTGAMTVPDTVDWGEWRTIRKHGITLSAGQHQLKLVMDSVNPTTFAVGVFNYLALTRSAPFGGTARAVPGKIEMEDFDVNADGGAGELSAYHDVTPANVGDAMYRFPEAVDIATTGDVGGGYQVGWTEDGEWLAYTVNVQYKSGYHLSMRVAHPGPGGTFHMELNGQAVTGPIQIPDTGAWDNWQTITALTFQLPAGVHVIYMVLDTTSGITGAVANVNHFELQPYNVVTTTSTALAINGNNEFYTSFSYFGAMDDTLETVIYYFNLAQTYGFDGVRLFPNWWPDNVGGPCAGGQWDEVSETNPTPALFRVDGTLDPTMKTKLKQVLDEAHQRGLIIEVALAHEMVRGLDGVNSMSFDKYRDAVRELTIWLRDAWTSAGAPQQSYPFIVFDLQNEFNDTGSGGCKRRMDGSTTDPHALSPSDPDNDIRPIVDIVKAHHPARLVMASIAYEAEPLEAWERTSAAGVDLISYHDRRTSDWSEATDNRVAELRQLSGGKLVYFSETCPLTELCGKDASGNILPAEKWWKAAQRAKRAGAIAWNWHNQVLFHWTGPGKPSSFHTVELQVGANLETKLANVCWGLNPPTPSCPPWTPSWEPPQ